MITAISDYMRARAICMGPWALDFFKMAAIYVTMT